MRARSSAKLYKAGSNIAIVLSGKKQNDMLPMVGGGILWSRGIRFENAEFVLECHGGDLKLVYRRLDTCSAGGSLQHSTSVHFKR